MLRANAPHTLARACAASPCASLTGYHVYFLGVGGTWRPIEDEADEPELFHTAAHAHRFAQSWTATFGIPTRVRNLNGDIVPSDAEIDAMWLDLRQQELAELAGLERRRASLARWIHGEAA
jgi:hypothetical protein